jgi:dihydrofolate reductase
MKIRTRMCMSLDGYVAGPDGRPAQLADPAWSPQAFGFDELQAACDAVLMGRTTFAPALASDRWPWPDLDVFVLASERPPGTPDDVVVERDPVRLLEHVRAANRGGDVHLVGGPRTVESFRSLGALDELGVIVLPLLLGGGLQFTPSVGTDARLTLERTNALPTGAVEIAYACT